MWDALPIYVWMIVFLLGLFFWNFVGVELPLVYAIISAWIIAFLTWLTQKLINVTREAREAVRREQRLEEERERLRRLAREQAQREQEKVRLLYTGLSITDLTLVIQPKTGKLKTGLIVNTTNDLNIRPVAIAEVSNEKWAKQWPDERPFIFELVDGSNRLRATYTVSPRLEMGRNKIFD